MQKKHNMLVLIVFLNVGVLDACTEIFMTSTNDKAVVVGRTLDFFQPLHSNIVYEPKNTYKASFNPPFCTRAQSFIWRSEYDVICLDAMKRPVCTDGMNSKGLSVASLLFHGFARYDNVTVNDCGLAVSHLQLVNYILGKFNSTKAVRKSLENKKFPKVFDVPINSMKIELHYSIVDSTGDAFVLEYTKDGRKVHDNKIHVTTGSPPYDFHLLNLKNYVHLSKFPKNPMRFKNTSIKHDGFGSGMLGVPGDFTSASRFVRVASMLNFISMPKDSHEGVTAAFHLLNTVDTTKGVVQVSHQNEYAVYTQWAIVKDLENLTIYIRTYDDISVRKLSMKDIIYNSKFRIPLNWKPRYQVLSEITMNKTKQFRKPFPL